MSDAEENEGLSNRLRIHRGNLRTLLGQLAAIGSIHAPPTLFNGINNERTQIRFIKATLRVRGQVVEDAIDDEAIEAIEEARSVGGHSVDANRFRQPANISATAASADSQVASAGFEALRELMRRPDVREVVGAFRADFQAVRKQIALMKAYKELHDLFQELELCYNTVYNFIYQDTDLIPIERLQWESLAYSEPDLQTCIEELLQCAAQPALTSERGAWQQQLERALHELQIAIEGCDATLLKQATTNIRIIINRQPSRINDRLCGAAKALREQRSAQALLMLREALAKLNLDTFGQPHFARFEQGVDALLRFGEQLERTIDLHNDFQEIDNQLRPIEATTPEQARLAYLSYVWQDLHPYTQRLCDNNRETWASRLSILTAELESALEQRVAPEIMRCFRKYRTQASRGFQHVDDSLLDLCHQLTGVGDSLALILQTIV